MLPLNLGIALKGKLDRVRFSFECSSRMLDCILVDKARSSLNTSCKQLVIDVFCVCAMHKVIYFIRI